MDKYQTGVKRFMVLAGQPTPEVVIEPTEEARVLRFRLIFEEALEAAHAAGVRIFCENEHLLLDKLDFVVDSEYNEVEYIDGLSDLKFVTIGGAVDAGIDLEPIDDEVWENNLSKFKDGYKDENGKWRKGPSYKPVNLKPLIDKQKEKSSEEQLELNLKWN